MRVKILGVNSQMSLDQLPTLEIGIIWTHRGRPYAEHTLDAFEQSWKAGIKHFEIDIRKTKDGTVVLTHDADIKRATGENLKIANLTFAQLQSYPINGLYPWLDLESFLANFPAATISIDFKSDDVLDSGIRILNNFQKMNIIIGSFSPKRTFKLRHELPWCKSALTQFEVAQLIVGIQPQSIMNQSCLAMVPIKQYGIKIITTKFIESCKKYGIPIHVWVVNSTSEMLKLFEMGVSGVVTDFQTTLNEPLNLK